jgi:hypothetical protein
VPRWTVSIEGDDGLRQWGLPSAEDTGTLLRVDALARRLAEAARSLQRQDRHCCSAAATSVLASDFDVWQDETGQGPRLDAIRQQ